MKAFANLHRKKIFLFVLTLTVLVVGYKIFTSKKAGAAWWNEGWTYRMKSTVTNGANALTDFQVSLTLNTSTLISAGKMQSDCDDIRVVGSDMTTLQDFYIEGCNTTVTKIWMKHNYSSNEKKDFWIYYGNSTAASGEVDPTTIFLIFDDFEAGAIDTNLWTNGFSPSNFSLSGGELSLWSNDSWKGFSLKTSAYDSSPTDLDTYEIKYKTASDQQFHIYFEQTNNRFAINPHYNGVVGPRIQYRENGGGYINNYSYATTSYNTYYIHRIDRTSSTSFTG